MQLNLENHEVSELFNLLDAHKDEHPELHEKVYQEMNRDLINRINQG